MKSLASSFTLFAVLLLGAVSSPTLRAATPKTDTQADQTAPKLQVKVDVPAIWRPFLADDVSETFADYIRDGFKKDGYAGKVVYIRPLDTPDSHSPLLTVTLQEWRVDRLGNVDCTFGATILTPDGKQKGLGVFTSTSFVWGPDIGRWELRDAFQDVAGQAISDLFHRLAKTDTVPGLHAS